MSNDNAKEVVEAAIAKAAFEVVAALQPLNTQERSRVLKSAAALFGVNESTDTPSRDGPAPPTGTEDGTPSSSGKIKRLSIVEFLQQKAPTSNPQRIACFARFREQVEGRPNFTRNDLSPYFPQAKLPNPKGNYGRDYDAAVKAGWIHDQGDKSYLTQKGERAVDAGFRDNAASRGSGGQKRTGG